MIFKSKPSHDGKRLCQNCGNSVGAGNFCPHCPGKLRPIPRWFLGKPPNRWRMNEKRDVGYRGIV